MAQNVEFGKMQIYYHLFGGDSVQIVKIVRKTTKRQSIYQSTYERTEKILPNKLYLITLQQKNKVYRFCCFFEMS